MLIFPVIKSHKKHFYTKNHNAQDNKTMTMAGLAVQERQKMTIKVIKEISEANLIITADDEVKTTPQQDKERVARYFLTLLDWSQK